jgi:hypothetical protein
MRAGRGLQMQAVLCIADLDLQPEVTTRQGTGRLHESGAR